MISATDLIYPARYFACFNEQGVPISFWHEAVHGYKQCPKIVASENNNLRELPISIIVWQDNPACLIPKNAIEITESQWIKYYGTNLLSS